MSAQVTRSGETEILTETFTYTAPSGTTTSSQIATCTTVANGYTVTYSYTYDDNGNILSVSDGTHTTSYGYDSLNQLIRENNQAGGFTHLWVYDNGGNILYRYEYAYTTVAELNSEPLKTVSYGYEEGTDILSSYDGKVIDNNIFGVSVYDNWVYEAEYGTQLTKMWKWDPETDRELIRTFAYNADGMRIRRTEPDGTVYNYIYNGSQLSQMTVGGHTLYFTYDANGTPLSVTLTDTGTNVSATYYYATNLQGDVAAILSSTGAVLVRYTYDAWGNICDLYTADSEPIATTLSTLNPLRYRGYVYDTETKLYYLQSRYYNPQWGRFISADDSEILLEDNENLLQYNLFAYCWNNPVNMIDYDGRDPISLTVTGVYLLCTAVIALFATSIVMSPTFQRNWNRMCTSIGYSVSRGLSALGGAIGRAAGWMSSKAGSIDRSIGNSFAKVKSIPKYRTPREVHHIVAKKASNAKYAREVLAKVGINYNTSAYNLVSIKTGLHRRLHTSDYYGWANSVVISAYNSANGNYSKQRRNVIAALNTIRAFVLSMDAVAPF